MQQVTDCLYLGNLDTRVTKRILWQLCIQVETCIKTGYNNIRPPPPPTQHHSLFPCVPPLGRPSVQASRCCTPHDLSYMSAGRLSKAE